MPVSIKSKKEIDIMKESGKILEETHHIIAEAIKPGMSTLEINHLGEKNIRKHGSIPSFLNYNGFPAAICISVNDEVVHGIPRKDVIIRDGDLVSLDIGVQYKGYHTDAARTVVVGEAMPEVKKLVEVTKQSFLEGIKFAKEGCHLFEISNAIANYAESFGYGIVRELVGHGIGKKLHEDPQIPNFRQIKRGMKLHAGMTLAIEPMINMGRSDVAWLDDNWTVVTEDGSLSAHYENTVLITDGEPQMLTCGCII